VGGMTTAASGRATTPGKTSPLCVPECVCAWSVSRVCTRTPLSGGWSGARPCLASARQASSLFLAVSQDATTPVMSILGKLRGSDTSVAELVCACLIQYSRSIVLLLESRVKVHNQQPSRNIQTEKQGWSHPLGAPPQPSRQGYEGEVGGHHYSKVLAAGGHPSHLCSLFLSFRSVPSLRGETSVIEAISKILSAAALRLPAAPSSSQIGTR